MQKLIFTNSRGKSVELGNSAPFLLEKIEGAGTPKTTILTSKAPGQDGKSYHGTLLEEGILPVQFSILGDDLEDLYRKEREVSSFFNPKMAGQCIYINDFRSYEINYVVESIITKERVGELQDVLLQLYLPNPFWLDNFISSKQMSYLMGGLTFPLKLPTQFSQRSFKRKFTNNGDVGTPILIEFYGPAQNPTIRNNTTGEFITVKRELKETDKLVINTEFENKRVEIVDLKGNKANVFNWIDLRSSFFSLVPGENEIEYNSNNDSKKTRVKISYKNRYIGV